MTELKYSLITEMLGDDKSSFIARDIKESYEDFSADLVKLNNKENYCRFFSLNDSEERKEIKKLLNAMKIMHSFYSTESID